VGLREVPPAVTERFGTPLIRECYERNVQF